MISTGHWVDLRLGGVPRVAFRRPSARRGSNTNPSESKPPIRRYLKLGYSYSPTAESFGVSAQIGSGAVRGGPEVRLYEGSTRVPHAVGDIT